MATPQINDLRMNFWSNITKIPIEQFHKPYKRKGKKGTYTFRSQYGTVLVGLHNVKLKEFILRWIEDYKQKILKCRRGSMVEQGFCKPWVGGSIPLVGC